MEFGGKDRKNPIYILIQKPDSSLISDSLGVAVVRSDLRPIIIKRTDRSGDRLRQKRQAIPQTYTQFYTLQATWNLSNLAIAVKSILGVKCVRDLPWSTKRSELKESRSQPEPAQK
ncbi:MAG: hypothetical protein EAZ39_04020 [Oscillatoriales cyanobacterium]|nr:MAG: hypothetical protein EAZ39_04020 [Oscillatoriales cyanobacterium]